jgi:peptide/nickel transport system substrate-binding protein
MTKEFRTSRRTLTLSAAGAVAAPALLGGIATAAIPAMAAAQDEGAVLRLGTNAADIANLDPHMASGTQDRTIVDMVYNGLIRFTPGDSTSFEPDIATEMPTAEENEDGTQTWTFTLRDDVMVHPSETAGTEAYALTSADVLFSYEKAANADISSYAGNYAGWTFAAPDDTTFEITLEAPLSESLFLPQVANYSGGYIVPQQPYEALGADGFLANPVGTGPFMFESYTAQQNVTLAAYPDFFRGAPQLAGVEVRFVADGTSRELALQSNDLDVIAGFPDSMWVDQMNQQDGITVDVFGVGEVLFHSLDVNHEILQDPLVREAILLAVNRENTLALAGSPVAEPVYSIVPEAFMPGGLSEDAANEAGVNFAQDIERAQELLAEAGYPDGFELNLVTSEMDIYRNSYTILQEELRQIGITVNLEVVQHQAMHELIREDSNAIVIYSAFRPTADVYLTQFFTSGGGVVNFSNYQLDDLVAEARTTTDADEQAALWEQANIEIIQNFAGYGLMYVNQVYAKRENVDYGHPMVSVVQLYPGIDENTSISS